MKEVQKTTLHPDNFPDIDLYPKTSVDQVDGLQEKIDNIPVGGVPVNVSGTTSGTFTDDQLQTLQASNLNYILLNGNEIFELADNQVESGFMIYSHLGYDAGKTQAKILSITISTKSFTIVTNEIGGGGTQLYRISGTYSISSDPKELFDAIQVIYTIKDGYIFIISLTLRGYQYASYNTVLLNMTNIFSKSTTIRIEACTAPYSFLEKEYSFTSNGYQFATVTTTGSLSNNAITIVLNAQNMITYGEKL